MQTIITSPPSAPPPIQTAALIVAALADERDAAALRYALGTLRARATRKTGGAS